MMIEEAGRRIARLTRGRQSWIGPVDDLTRAAIGKSGDGLGAASAEWKLAVASAEAGCNSLLPLLNDARAGCGQLLVLLDASGVTRPVREEWDRVAISAGWRRHVRLFDLTSYSEIEGEAGWILLAYQRVADDLVTLFPTDWLIQGRDLHMDMTREAGRRSDAHLARYVFASARIPSKARILDGACGLGYGAAILGRDMPDRSILGIDIDRTTVEYARAHFGEEERIKFKWGDVRTLQDLDDATFDAVVSFETLEHIADPEKAVRRIFDVLCDSGIFIGSVPYRWVVDEDTGPYHADWFDARKLIRLCSRFLVVEELWTQTAGGGPFCSDSPRTWRKMESLGEEPCVAAEWVVVVARRQRLAPWFNPGNWLFLAPGVPQLTTMAAAAEQWNCEAADVTVFGTSSVADSGFHTAMSQVAGSCGYSYGGNLFIDPEIRCIGDPLCFDPADPTNRDSAGDRALEAYPILQSLRGCRLVLTARPNMPSDYVLAEALRPQELRVVADGIQNDVIVRDFSGARGFPDNPLARFPAEMEVWCPPWLKDDAAQVGTARSLPEAECRRVLAKAAGAAAFSQLRCQISDPVEPFAAVVVSQHLARSWLTSADAELVFYIHQLRLLLRKTRGRVLFKAHPRDPAEKIERLRAFLGPEGRRIFVTSGAEAHAPLEAFPEIADRGGRLHVWGTSSSALLGVRGWKGVELRVVSADYLEAEVHRQAIGFSRQHAVPLVALGFVDPVLQQCERELLKRRLIGASHLYNVRSVMWHGDVSPSEVSRLRTRLSMLNGEVRQLRDVALEKTEYKAQILNLILSLLAPRSGEGQRPIIIWGAGSGGRRMLRLLRCYGLSSVAFVDSDVAKQGGFIEGIRIESDCIAEVWRRERAVVFVASGFAPEIAALLVARGWRTNEDFIVVDFAAVEALEGRIERARHTSAGNFR